MFFGLAETITNQTVAVAVLVMILGGLGWLIRQLFSLAPTVLDRLDKQEEKRTESMEKMADRLEKAIDKLAENFKDYMCEVRDCIDESNRVKTLLLSRLNSIPDNNKSAKAKEQQKEGV